MNLEWSGNFRGKLENCGKIFLARLPAIIGLKTGKIAHRAASAAKNKRLITSIAIAA